MKQKGAHITGDPVRVDSFTSTWESVRIHPITFYKREDEFSKGLSSAKGFYTNIDMGDYILFRFSEKEDVVDFHKRHKEFL